MFWASYFPFISAFYLCKATLLTFYAPLFPEFMRKRRIVYWAVCIYTGLAFFVSMVLNLSACTPVSANWIFDEPGTCINDADNVVFVISWGLHFSSDIMRIASLTSCHSDMKTNIELVFCLPLLVLHNITIATNIKVAVYTIFLLGIFTMAFALARFVILEVVLLNWVDQYFHTFSLVGMYSSKYTVIHLEINMLCCID